MLLPIIWLCLPIQVLPYGPGMGLGAWLSKGLGARGVFGFMSTLKYYDSRELSACASGNRRTQRSRIRRAFRLHIPSLLRIRGIPWGL